MLLEYDVGQFHAWILEFLKLGVEETLGTSILPPKILTPPTNSLFCYVVVVVVDCSFVMM